MNIQPPLFYTTPNKPDVFSYPALSGVSKDKFQHVLTSAMDRIIGLDYDLYASLFRPALYNRITLVVTPDTQLDNDSPLLSTELLTGPNHYSRKFATWDTLVDFSSTLVRVLRCMGEAIPDNQLNLAMITRNQQEPSSYNLTLSIKQKPTTEGFSSTASMIRQVKI